MVSAGTLVSGVGGERDHARAQSTSWAAAEPVARHLAALLCNELGIKGASATTRDGFGDSPDLLARCSIAGGGEASMTAQAMTAGAAEYLTTPLSDGALLGAVRDAMERSRAALEPRPRCSRSGTDARR
jgi:hypothetical protein